MNESQNKYDLEERTARFGEAVISFCKTLKEDSISKPLISQIVRSSTSVGANYTETNGASSKRDFRNKIYICKKEAQETKHWLRMLAKCFPEKVRIIKTLWKEAQELTLIFGKIVSKLKK
jgi:four helix bundle protein